MWFRLRDHSVGCVLGICIVSFVSICSTSSSRTRGSRLSSRRNRQRTGTNGFGISGKTLKDTQNRCQEIRIRFCKDMPYNLTSLPNVLGHTNQKRVRRGLKDFRTYLQPPCHKNLKFLICSVYLPACDSEDVYGDVLPCKSVCNDVKSSCEHLFLDMGIDWPHMFQCDKFPDKRKRFCLSPEVNLPMSFSAQVKHKNGAQIHKKKVRYDNRQSNSKAIPKPTAKSLTLETERGRTAVLRETKYSRAQDRQKEVSARPTSMRTIFIGNREFPVRTIEGSDGFSMSESGSHITPLKTVDSDNNMRIQLATPRARPLQSSSSHIQLFDDENVKHLQSVESDGVSLSDVKPALIPLDSSDVDGVRLTDDGAVLKPLESVKSEDTIILNYDTGDDDESMKDIVLPSGGISNKSSAKEPIHTHSSDVWTEPTRSTGSPTYKLETTTTLFDIDLNNSNISTYNHSLFGDRDQSPDVVSVFTPTTVIIYASVIFVVILTAVFFNRIAFSTVPKRRIVQLVDDHS